MDREFIKNISIDYYINKNLNGNNIATIIKDYCCNIHDKDKDSTEVLIQLVLSNFHVMHDIFEQALEYYEKQFHIIKIIDKNRILKIQ